MPNSTYTLEEQAAHRAELKDALLNGEYVQGKGALRAGKQFCCLGVACDISDIGEWEPYPVDWFINYNVAGESPAPGALPRKVADYYGFATLSGHLREGAESPYETLADANDDDEGATFEEIAELLDWVEVVK